MKIKKMFQGTVPENKILNTHSDSQTDVYACDYINKLNTYSTEEVRIGTWADGKPLYRKSFIGSYTNDDVLIENIDTLVNAYGTMLIQGIDRLIPYYEYYNSKHYTARLQLLNNKISILALSASTGVTTSGKFTIEYTKTTD